jgi:succinate dehydrogenase / fumarate reductase flavoprotein subunit
LGGNSLSDLLVFGKRAGAFAAQFAQQHSFGEIAQDQIENAAKSSLKPFDKAGNGRDGNESPYLIQEELQERMQELVGIVRTEAEMKQALVVIAELKERADKARIDGNRQYNSGWHTALALRNMLTVAEVITRAALERRESRGAHFREDYQRQEASQARFNLTVAKTADGEVKVRQQPIPEMRPDLKQIIEEMK